MGAFSMTHIFVVLGVAVFLFGRGAVKGWCKDLATGIKEFRKATSEVTDVKEKVTGELEDLRQTTEREVGVISRLNPFKG